MSPWYTLPRIRARPLPIPATGKMAETQMAQQSIHCKILTASETLMLVGVLTGILMLAGILTKILRLAVFLIGILILARILTRIAIPSGTARSEEIEISDGIERQSWTELNPLEAGSLSRNLTLNRMLGSEEIEILDGMEHPSRTELELFVAEHAQHWGNNTGGGPTGYTANETNRSRNRKDRIVKWYESLGKVLE